MVFSPTPPRNNAPSQLLSLGSILAATGGGEGGNASFNNIALTSTPANTTVGAAISLVGTVAPSGTAVRAGLSSSATVAPTSWTTADVSENSWSASLTPSAAGTYYAWVQQTAATNIQAISAAITVAAGASGSIAITSQPTTGTAGATLSIAGTVSPSGTAVQVGLSTSASIAPANWTSATVSGTGWTASLTPSAAGTYYIWAEQTGATSVQAVSAAVTVAASGGSALTYSLIAGSGNSSLTGVTMTTGTSQTADWTSSIVHGSTDVRPSVVLSAVGAAAACSFWFDTSSTNTTVPGSNYGSGSFNGNAINFYANSAGFGTPICAPAAPSAPGTYYGKYALYNSSNMLLGVFTTSAITVS